LTRGSVAGIAVAGAALAVALAALPAAPARGEDGGPSLDEAVEHLLAVSGLPRDRVGVAVLDPRDGRVLADAGASRPLTPASCLKVATTGAALLALGEEFPLRTLLLAVPPARGEDPSVVAGALWLLGRGDPGLSEHGPEGDTLRALDAFAGQVAARGVRSVKGDLVFDASWFSGPRLHPSWTDAGTGRWYAAEVDALTVNDGCVDVSVEPGPGPGSPGKVDLRPTTGILEVANHVLTTGARKEHGFAFALAGAGGVLEVTGRVWTGSRGAVLPAAVRDPALLCAEQVGRALARAGVRVEGVIRRPREAEAPPAGASLLAEHRTTLGAACRVANERSQNLWAETILRVLGRERRGEGSFAAGAAAVREVLAPAGPGVEALLPVDGSGLSREDRASALALARVLALLHRSRARDAFFGGLARPGTGTLDDRFRERRFEGRLFAKTGTLRGVSGLCGLALGAGDRPLVFAVLAEGVDVGRARALQDAVAGALVAPAATGLRAR